MKEKMKIDSLKKKTVVFIFIITVFCTLVPAFIAYYILLNKMTSKKIAVVTTTCITMIFHAPM